MKSTQARQVRSRMLNPCKFTFKYDVPCFSSRADSANLPLSFCSNAATCGISIEDERNSLRPSPTCTWGACVDSANLIDWSAFATDVLTWGCCREAMCGISIEDERNTLRPSPTCTLGACVDSANLIGWSAFATNVLTWGCCRERSYLWNFNRG